MAATMNTQEKLATGSLLAVVGGIGITLGVLGTWSGLGRPWTFLIGFAFGLCTGLGGALSIKGLLETRGDR